MVNMRERLLSIKALCSAQKFNSFRSNKTTRTNANIPIIMTKTKARAVIFADHQLRFSKLIRELLNDRIKTEKPLELK